MSSDAERLSKALVASFYVHVEGEPALRAMYPKHLRCAVMGLEAFLIRLFGGESSWPSQPVHGFHRRLKIDGKLRDAWVRSMSAAVTETVTDEDLRDELLEFFQAAATQLINIGSPEPVIYGRWPCPHADVIEQAWSRHHATDLAFAAAHSGDVDTLAKVAADVCVPLEDILFVAANGGHLAAMEILFQHGAMGANTQMNGQTLVDHPEAAEMLLSRGAPIDGVPGSEPPLIRSCRGDRKARPREVEALLARGANPNIRGREGRTPLHYAGRAHSSEVWDILIRHGADPSLADDNGKRPALLP